MSLKFIKNDNYYQIYILTPGNIHCNSRAQTVLDKHKLP